MVLYPIFLVVIKIATPYQQHTSLGGGTKITAAGAIGK